MESFFQASPQLLKGRKGIHHRDLDDPLLASLRQQPGDSGPGNAQFLGYLLLRKVVFVIQPGCLKDQP